MNFQLEIQTGTQAGFNFRIPFVDFPSRKPDVIERLNVLSAKARTKPPEPSDFLAGLLADYEVVQMLLRSSNFIEIKLFLQDQSAAMYFESFVLPFVHPTSVVLHFF